MPNPNPTVDNNVAAEKYSHQTANGTFTIFTGPCVLSRILLNTQGVADTITVYDNTTGSGTVIAVINDAVGSSFTFDIQCAIGLTIVVAGTTPPDITVIYRT